MVMMAKESVNGGPLKKKIKEDVQTGGPVISNTNRMSSRSLWEISSPLTTDPAAAKDDENRKLTEGLGIDSVLFPKKKKKGEASDLSGRVLTDTLGG